MKKSLFITATALLIFVGCTEDKKESVEQAPKVEVSQSNVTESKPDNKIENVKEEVKAVNQKIEDKKTQESKVAEASNQTIDAEVLFKTCASCHGQKGEKEAMGKSQVITGWDKDRVIKALNGYKDGSYGGVMKGIMKPHVETKTEKEIEVIADFVSKLN